MREPPWLRWFKNCKLMWKFQHDGNKTKKVIAISWMIWTWTIIKIHIYIYTVVQENGSELEHEPIPPNNNNNKKGIRLQCVMRSCVLNYQILFYFCLDVWLFFFRFCSAFLLFENFNTFFPPFVVLLG